MLTKRPSIAIPVLSLRYHGGIKILIEIANKISTWADVHFLVPEGCIDTTYEISPNVKLIEVRTGKLPRFLTCGIFLVRCIPMLARYDLILANFFVTWYSSVLASYLGNAKIFYIVQDIESKYKSYIAGRILNQLCEFTYRSKYIVTANPFLENEIVKRGNKPVFNFTVGVTELFFSTPLSDCSKNYDVVYFARGEKWKNLDLFIDFIANNESHLNIAVVSQDIVLLQELSKKYSDNKEINLLKPENTSQLIDILDHSKVMLSTSLHEGFSLPPLEAMSRGLSVLLYPSGGPDLYVNDGVNAIYFKNRQELEENLKELLGNTTRMSNLGDAGIVTASRFRFSIELERLSTFLSNNLTY